MRNCLRIIAFLIGFLVFFGGILLIFSPIYYDLLPFALITCPCGSIIAGFGAFGALVGAVGGDL